VSPLHETVAVDPAVRLVLRAGLAVLLLATGVAKLRAPAAFRAALAGYALLPGAWVPAAAALFVALELVLGAALLVPGAGAAPALGAAALLAGYSAAIAANLARGRRDIDCGCAGPAGRRALDGGLVLRNAVLVAAALAAALPAAGRPLAPLDAFTVAAGTGVAALLYAAADAALALAPRLARLRGKT
jgi:Methylamine utilisation protein MauE